MGKIPSKQTTEDYNCFTVSFMFINNSCISNFWKLDILCITDPLEKKTEIELQEETLRYFQNNS